MATKLIRTQFPESSEANLMMAVIEQALRDLLIGDVESNGKIIPHADRASAARYLSGSIHHAEICGVESEWIRRVLAKVGLDERLKT